MGQFGNDDKHEVQAATDLVRLIGEQLQLRPKGREFAGLCPFHDDKSPSMFVSPAKQIYKCFSCGAGGDCFSFVMDFHKMEFVESLNYLADRAGIKLTPRGQRREDAMPVAEGESAETTAQSPRKRLLNANEQAMRFYQANLNDAALGQTARDYITQRGISDAMVEQFAIGYAPDSWDTLAKHVAVNKLDRIAFEKGGLIASKSTGDDYDKLRHRLIFPICDDLGRPVAFGGRVMPGGTLDDPSKDAKYLNSPETPIFNKSQTLYGLHHAKQSIISQKTAVIVEGYTDVIACHQHGATNVVAALGTAFTHQHAAKVRRFCETVVLVFDGDAAGKKAADRAVEVLLTGEIDVSIVILPEGEDPDQIMSAPDGPARWEQLLSEARSALPFLLDGLKDDLAAGGTITGRQSVSTEFLQRLAGHGLATMPPIRRSLILGQLSQMLHLPESAVLEEVRRLKPRRVSAVSQEGSRDAQGEDEALESQNSEAFGLADPLVGATLKGVALAERQLIGSLLRNNDLFEHTLPDGADFCEAVMAGDLSLKHQLVFHMIHDRLAQGAEVTVATFVSDLVERGLDEARGIVILAVAELDRMTGGLDDRVLPIFETAVDAVRSRAEEREYVKTKQQTMQATTDDEKPVSDVQRAAQAQRLSEQRVAKPFSGRFKRINL